MLGAIGLKKQQKNWLLILLGSGLILTSFVGFMIQNRATNNYDSMYEETTLYAEEGPQSEFAYRATEQLRGKGIDIPLFLQTDERWQEEYADDSYTYTLAENGSGFASLAMLLSYYDATEYVYDDLYALTFGDYFTADGSLKWKFFEEASESFGTPVTSLGNNFDKVQTLLANHQPIIVSFKPGTFIDSEHFVVLFQTDDQTIRVLDPLDSPEREIYTIDFAPKDLTDKIQNYWAVL